MDLTKTINTPYNNAVALVDRMNALLLENNILDSTGTEIAQMDQNPTNPGWLFALACGSLHTSWQEQLSKAYAALDPQSCEEDQVLVLAALAGLQRGNGTPSNIMVTIENESESQLTIPYGTEFRDSYANQNWYSNRELILAPGERKAVLLYSGEDGAFAVPQGATFTCDDFSDITIIADSASVEGESIESIASLRNRISQGVETSDFKAKAATAIGRLPGIESCSIWFNQSPSNTIVIQGKSIPPRNAYVSIKGVDSRGEIAKTYFSYLDVPATVGAMEDEYVRGQQPLKMKYDVAQGITIPIWVTIDGATAAVGASDAIKEKVAQYSGTLACGENVTAQMVSEWLANLGYGTIVGCNVGTETGLTSNIDADQFCVFEIANITVKDRT